MIELILKFVPADKPSLILFTVFSIVMFAACYFALMKADAHVNRRPIRFLGTPQVGFFALVSFFKLVVFSGLPLSFTIPTVPILFVTLIGYGIWLSFSRYGEAIGECFPLAVLVGFQGFRLPLEIILHHWAEIGTVPPTMTWTGQNYDILSGVVAILFIPLVKLNKKLAWIPTIVGSLLLLNVLRVVVLSSPIPFGWHLENPLQLVMYLPYALIGPLFVMPALIGHLVVSKKLINGK